MGDGRALQAGTSHNLGQNFAKAFDITFQARDKSVQHVWGTSWGVTTRLVGARDHDARRRQRPGAAAARGAVSGRDRADRARQLARDGAAARAGDSAASSPPPASASRSTSATSGPGWKFAEWELRGVPLRLEIGPKDIEKSQVLLARRDTREKLARADGRPRRDASRELLDDIQQTLLERARAVPRGAHAARRELRRSSSSVMEGRPGLRHRAVVRVGRVRGADQDRHAGDDPQHAARTARAGRAVRPLRQPARPPRRGSRKRTNGTTWLGRPQLLQQRRIALRAAASTAAWRRVKPSRRTIARNASARWPRHHRSLRSTQYAAASGSRHDASPTASRAVRNSTGSGSRAPLRSSRASRRARCGCRGAPARRERPRAPPSTAACAAPARSSRGRGCARSGAARPEA